MDDMIRMNATRVAVVDNTNEATKLRRAASYVRNAPTDSLTAFFSPDEINPVRD